MREAELAIRIFIDFTMRTQSLMEQSNELRDAFSTEGPVETVSFLAARSAQRILQDVGNAEKLQEEAIITAVERLPEIYQLLMRDFRAGPIFRGNLGIGRRHLSENTTRAAVERGVICGIWPIC